MDVSFTNSRMSIDSARRADTDWASLTLPQRIRSIELDGYVVIPDLLSATQLDAIRVELSEDSLWPHGKSKLHGNQVK